LAPVKRHTPHSCNASRDGRQTCYTRAHTHTHAHTHTTQILPRAHIHRHIYYVHMPDVKCYRSVNTHRPDVLEEISKRTHSIVSKRTDLTCLKRSTPNMLNKRRAMAMTKKALTTGTNAEPIAATAKYRGKRM
jgi:hypothetical protein